MEIRLIGASWCAPCKAVKQYLETSGVVYEYLDIDDEETLELASTYGIRSVPAVMKIEDDVDRVYVGSNINEIKKFLGE